MTGIEFQDSEIKKNESSWTDDRLAQLESPIFLTDAPSNEKFDLPGPVPTP
jgi:hypothetical protein